MKFKQSWKISVHVLSCDSNSVVMNTGVTSFTRCNHVCHIVSNAHVENGTVLVDPVVSEDWFAAQIYTAV